MRLIFGESDYLKTTNSRSRSIVANVEKIGLSGGIIPFAVQKIVAVL